MADVSAPLAPPDDLVELGRIVSAYGVRGWVKVQPHSSQAEVLRSAPQWWLTPFQSPLQAAGSTRPPQPSCFDVVQVRPQGSTIVAELRGLRDRGEAEAMRGQVVSVSRAHFPAAHPDEYYWVDLIGCQVFGISAEQPAAPAVSLGVVHDVADNGAHAILRVRRHRVQPDGSVEPLLDAKGRAQEMLIPFVEAHVSHVDLSARRIDTDWPDAF